jgi:membrane protein required for colicin V production
VGAFDWIALGVLGISLLVGAWRGLVYELLSVLGWVAAFVLAQMFAPSVATSLPMSGSPEVLRYAAAFVLVFIGVAFAAGLLSWLVKKLIEAVGLRPIDRTLGAGFGLLRGAVLLLAAAVVVGMTPFKEAAWWKDSTSAPVLVTGLKGLKPVLPADFGRYLP